MQGLANKIAELTYKSVTDIRFIASSGWAEVWRAVCVGDERFAIKIPLPGARSTSRIEARMLRYLEEHSSLPVPRVHAVSDDILVMDYIENGGTIDALDVKAQRHAGRLIANLHNVEAKEFGLDFDTVFGPIDQPNAASNSWISFFRVQRLVHMAREAEQRGRITADFRLRVEKLGGRLSDIIPEHGQASLLHGDLWQGNILVKEGRVAAFIDPAIYFGDAEMDLAFSTLFGTATSDFFSAYKEIRPILPGFHDERRDLYNLWPLLGHVALFGGRYVAQTDAILRRYGV